MNTTTTFKRLPVGVVFLSGRRRYRKATATAAFALNAEGRGQTHVKVPFTRSASVATSP